MNLQGKARPSYRCGTYVVDGYAAEVRGNGKPIRLSSTAFEVLYQLVERRGDLILRREFSSWKREEDSNKQDYGASPPEWRRPVDMYIVELRRKLGDSIVESIRGRGYRLKRGLAVEVIATPSATELDRMATIALNQIKEHHSVSFRAAIENCQELLKVERIADAYAVLALAYVNLGHVGFCREQPRIATAKARSVIKEALCWFPKFGSMYALRGLTSLIYDYDWDNAESEFRETLKMSPNNELGHCFLSHLLVAKGMFDEGLEHARIAAETDYESAMTVVTEPWLMMFAGRIEDAVATGERVVKRFEDFGPGHAIMGHIYRAAHATDKAIEHYRAALRIDFLPEVVASLGFIQGRLGNRKAALRHLSDIYRAKKTVPLAYVSSYFDALVYAGLDESSRALDALYKSLEEKCDWLIYLGVEPRWSALRTDRRFADLMGHIGLKKRRYT
jgi:tetratricopeptide (TPR) repeat protein